MKKLAFLFLHVILISTLYSQNLYTGKIPESLRWSIEEFTISENLFYDTTFNFYHETIYESLLKMDTSVTSEQILAYLGYFSTNAYVQLNSLLLWPSFLASNMYFMTIIHLCGGGLVILSLFTIKPFSRIAVFLYL